jgi:pimeloyl-ACP methyl ester carboxylesterase
MKMPEAQDSDTIAVYSERLSAMVDRVRRLTGAPRVNLVCHCMGGLVAKGMIQYFHDGRLGFPGPNGGEPWQAVNRLVTLASPLRGNRFFGFLPLLAKLDVPYYRKGFRRQAQDMVRGSEFLRRLNQGPRWTDLSMGDPGSCYKPEGRDRPPFYVSLTSDSYLFMDGGVEIAGSRCSGIPGSTTHLPDDVFALMYETPDGRCTFEKGRRLVHVPEDVFRDFVVEDKCKALTDYILKNFEPDVPIVFVHGSYLFRGLAELSWQVMMRRLAGEVDGWPAAYRYALASPGGEPDFWLLDANYDLR